MLGDAVRPALCAYGSAMISQYFIAIPHLGQSWCATHGRCVPQSQPDRRSRVAPALAAQSADNPLRSADLSVFSHKVGVQELRSTATKREREATRHRFLPQYKVAWLPEWSSPQRDMHGKTSDGPYDVQSCYRWHRRMLYRGLWKHVGNARCRVSPQASKMREVLKRRRRHSLSA